MLNGITAPSLWPWHCLEQGGSDLSRGRCRERLCLIHPRPVSLSPASHTGEAAPMLNDSDSSNTRQLELGPGRGGVC